MPRNDVRFNVLMIVKKEKFDKEINSIITVNSRYLELSWETNKFVRDIESSTYRVVILCKLIRMVPIVLFKT